MDEFRDDGTRVCPIHGLRFDPELSEGCIKCGHPSLLPKKRSTAPSGSRPPGSEVPPSYRSPPRSSPSYTPPAPMRPMTPMVPFEPLDIPLEPFTPGARSMGGLPSQGMGQSMGSGGPITLLVAPERAKSRRSLILGLGLVAVAGSGVAAWLLGPEGPTDWKKKISEFRYGPGASHSGALFVPSSASDGPRPLLVLIDHERHPVDSCLRYARHCEQHGWVAVSSDAFGNSMEATDGAEATALVDEARTREKIDGGRPIVAGFDVAGEVACRLALTQPDVFGGAILECTGTTSWREVGALAQNDLSFFLFTRTNDPSRDKMVTMKDEMEHPAFVWLDSLRA